MPNETTEEAKVQDAQANRVVSVVQVGGPTSVVVHQAATTRVVAAHQSNVGSTGQRLVSNGGTPQAASPSVLVVAKVSPPGLSATGQTALRVARPAPVISVKSPAPGHTAVPRTTVPPPLAPRPPQTPSTQLPANFQIPPGMVLIRSESGQLMLVSRQTLAQAQAQQAQKACSFPAPSLPTPVVTAAPPDKLMVIRVAAPPTTQTTAAPPPPAAAARVQMATTLNRDAPKLVVVQPLSAVMPPGAQPRTQTGVKETPASTETTYTITKETLDNVKKCKNFLVTLIKLASSSTQSPDMARNVKALVQSLLNGGIEPEEFTYKLYIQLKSTPQPYLVPFLKKSLPAVRHLTSDTQLFIQQAGQPKPQPAPSPGPKPTLAPLPPAARPPGPYTASSQTLKHVVLDKYPSGLPFRPAGTQLTNPRVVVLSGQQHPGVFSFKRPSVPPQPTPTYAFKDTSYKEDDDINDVPSMAGVNLKEESVRILASGGTVVGSVVQSCHDVPFLALAALHARILQAGEPLGVSEARPEVVTLVSQATQEFLQGLLEKLTVAAEHRKTSLKEDLHHTQVSDVRSQLHFLEQVELLKKQRQDEQEKETLLRLATRRSHSVDREQQDLWQRAKELQQVELVQLQHREANLAAQAAIGPRKKRPLDSTGNVSVLARSRSARATRVTMRELVLCMEKDRRMRRSLTLYKALMRHNAPGP